jgi:hypothetical protein
MELEREQSDYLGVYCGCCTYVGRYVGCGVLGVWTTAILRDISYVFAVLDELICELLLLLLQCNSLLSYHNLEH